MRLFPVILSGGVGTRLWPVSRIADPKQLHALTSKFTLLQETALRVTGALDDGVVFEAPLVVCNAAHQGRIAEQLATIASEEAAFILEPEGRNTAPAAALAALAVSEVDPTGVLCLLAADHVIADTDGFRDAIGKAARLAWDGFVVTYGIVPSHPETGYGYIRRGDSVGGDNGLYRVAAFKEKPNLEVAQKYLASGDYYWNSGIFTVRADKLIQEMERYCPQILEVCRNAVAEAVREDRVIRPSPEIFVQCPADSIDYAVMEHTDDAAVIGVDIGWNDVGSWSALYDIGQKDARGNVTIGDALALESHNNLIRSERRLIAAVGVDNLVIVETEDAILITTRENAQNVKDVVELLKQTGRGEL